MIVRLVCVFCIAAACASAQWRLFTIESGQEAPVGTQLDLGSTFAGDPIEKRLRLRNTGTAQAILSSLSVGGAGFALITGPTLPLAIAAGNSVDFALRFAPADSGSFSAVLRADTLSVFLLGSARVAPRLTGEDGQTIMPDTAIDFGTLEPGARATRRFTLFNPSSQPLQPLNIAVSGASFRGGGSLGRLDPGASVSFAITFLPAVIGPQEGTLSIDGRVFRLAGSGIEPPSPAIFLSLELSRPASAQQGRVAVRLSSAARSSIGGRLQMEFRPAAAGAFDPAILFVENGSRSAEFVINAGESSARFGAADALSFQTGTTAGTLVFTAELGTSTDRVAAEIAPAVPGIDNVAAIRSSGALQVRVTGFDNTRTISGAAFTFYGYDGVILAPGVIRAAVDGDFRRYFTANNIGGVFALTAVFPVTGVAEQIEGVEVELTNSAGVSKSQRVRF